MTIPAPETLDPVEHHTSVLGKMFRGILVNHDTRPIAVRADPDLFVEGTTPLWDEPIDLPRKQSRASYLLEPERAALFEWFSDGTVIDWYELARMPAGKAFEARMVPCIPYTTITVNYAGDEQWMLPAMEVTLKMNRLPVYLPLDRKPGDRTLFLLGRGARGVGCSVQTEHPRVPKVFEDLNRLD